MAKKEHVKNQILYVANTAYEEQESKGNKRKNKESSKLKDL